MDPINFFVGINIIAIFITQAKTSKNQLKLLLFNTVNKPVSFEGKLLLKHFDEDYSNYKKKTVL